MLIFPVLCFFARRFWSEPTQIQTRGEPLFFLQRADWQHQLLGPIVHFALHIYHNLTSKMCVHVWGFCLSVSKRGGLNKSPNGPWLQFQGTLTSAEESQRNKSILQLSTFFYDPFWALKGSTHCWGSWTSFGQGLHVA